MSTEIGIFGDNDSNRVIVIDVKKWEHVKDIPTGEGPYPIDQVSEKLVIASTRKERSVTPIELLSLSSLGKLELSHKPRSTTAQKSTSRALVGGADKVMTTVLDVSSAMPRPIAEVGSGATVDPSKGAEDYGGSLASGHPAWLDDGGDRFFLLDRITRRIEVYACGNAEPLWTQNTPTSAHHIFRYPGETRRWYAVCEGSQTSLTPPSIIEIRETNGIMEVVDQVFLPVDRSNYSTMGGHHCDAHPDGVHIYFGSAEGNCYVVDRGGNGGPPHSSHGQITWAYPF